MRAYALIALLSLAAYVLSNDLITIPLNYTPMPQSQLYAMARRGSEDERFQSGTFSMMSPKIDGSPIYLMSEYHLAAKMGTPTQQLYLMIDTGNKVFS